LTAEKRTGNEADVGLVLREMDPREHILAVVAGVVAGLLAWVLCAERVRVPMFCSFSNKLNGYAYFLFFKRLKS
jgi:hypothetical protein